MTDRHRRTRPTGNWLPRWSVLVACTLALGTLRGPAAPVITEFMASNDGALIDGNGVSSDWIEVHNPDDTEVDLAGYHLSDRPSQPDKWSFPAGTLLPAGGFLVVFASGDDTPDAAGHLHTNFSLSAGGEYVSLHSPAGTLLSEFNAGGTDYPPQQSDVSYGLAFEAPAAPDSTTLIGNSLSAGQATAGNGSFEDTDPSSGVGYPNRWAANGTGQVATVDGWSAFWESGYIGFDNDNTASHGAIYGFVNDDSRATFQSAPIAVDLLEGDTLDLGFDITTNAAGGKLDLTVSIIFDNGGDGNFPAFTHETPVANTYSTRSFQHTVTSAQQDATTVAVRIHLDNNTGGPTDQPRFDNVSLVSSHSSVTTLIHDGSNARWLIPPDDSIDASWMLPSFDDSDWSAGATPLGYENKPTSTNTYSPILVTTVPSGTRTTYLRQRFNLTDAHTVQDLLLSLQYDDGFIAYLNGTRIAADNDPGSPGHNSAATSDHPDADAHVFTPFSLHDHLGLLVEGENVLAIHALNLSSSSDYLINPRLTADFSPESFPTLREPPITGFLINPTPGTHNTEVRAGSVLFATAGGTFTTPFELTLTPDDPGETIRYTLDGSAPSDSSPIYSAPLSISTTTWVRARAFSTNGGVGDVSGETYIAVEPELAGFSSHLPVIVLDNLGQGNPLDKVFRPSFLTVHEPDPISGQTTLTTPPAVAERSAWHRRGSSSFTFSKPNYRLEIRDQNDADKNVSLLGLPAESDWILSTFARFDRAMVRNPIAMETSRQAGNYAPRTRYVEVFFNQDGDNLEPSDYFGVYMLTESIKRDDNRIDIAKLDATDNTGEDLTGGYIIKSDRTSSGDYTFRTSRGIPTGGGGVFISVEPDGPEITNPQKAYIRDYVQEFEDALYGTDFQHPSTGQGYGELIDIGSFIDQHIFQVYNKGPDALRFSTFFYKDRGGKLAMGPIWDQERIMGVETDTGTNRARNPENWNGDGDVSDLFHYDWWERLFQDPDFTQHWIDRWEVLRTSVYNPGNISSRFDGYEAQLLGSNPLDSPVTRNFIRWGASASNSGGEAWPNSRIQTSSSPTSNNFYQFADVAITSGFSDPATAPTASNILAYWRAEMDHIRNWNTLRLAWIYTNLPRLATFDLPPGPVAAGSTVAIIPPAGMEDGAGIWFTIDGSDPRAPGGAPSSSAALWSGAPIPVASSLFLTARVLDPANSNPRDQVLGQANSYDVWSAPIRAFYETGTRVLESLVISEINYNPHPPSAAELLALPGIGSDDFEFLELLNTHPSDSINLSGSRFTDGITFPFGDLLLGPGERVVIVSNPAAFATRYGSGIPISGRFQGNLDNNGERLTLVDGADFEILSITYGDSHLWDNGADGSGRTLVLRDPAATPRNQLGKSYRWQGSASRGGTPGTTATTTPPSVVINELLTRTEPPQLDAIELHNPTASPIDISGWFLSDSALDPLKFEIPADTILESGDYIVFDESDFNPNPVSPDPDHFALDGNSGDEVWLVIPDAGLTNAEIFVDHLAFGAASTGESLGRWPDGAGRLVPMRSVTLGSENALPRNAGPLIITEASYHPGSPSAAALARHPSLTDDDLEFIELHNPTPDTADLSGWRLRGEADIDFPPGLTLPASSCLTAISFNPDDPANVTRLEAFRIHYAIDASARFIGGYDGHLDNSEGRITLEYPGPPPADDPDFTPYLAADELVYDDLAPWPDSADGGGSSLHRACAGCVTGDPANWFGLAPTPGSLSFAAHQQAFTARIDSGPEADEITITWNTHSGASYTIMESADLRFWSDFLTLPASGTTTSVAIPHGDSQRFLRIRWNP